MKKIIALFTLIILVLTLVSCAAKRTDADSQLQGAEETNSSVSEITESGKEETSKADTVSGSVYGQDPFAVIPGKYTAIGQRSRAVVTSPAIDTLQIVITGSGSAANFAEWTLTGKLDNSLRLNFKDSVLRLLTYNENGEIVNEDIEYTDGSGTVVFDKNAVRFTWNDDKSENGAVTFVLEKDQEN